MIETEPTVPAQEKSSFARELALHVWLRQTELDGQFVEIIMPPFELNDILEECMFSFPQYVVQVLEILARQDPSLLGRGITFTPEQTKGLMNTQILGTVLARDQVRGQNAIPVLRELHQAFGLAMKGRLRLTADPLPEI